MKLAGLLLFPLALMAPPAQAASVLYSLAIGHNGLPPDARAEGIGELSFADDDALAVHELARTVARRSLVLALPDRATQARYPGSSEARPPSVSELRRALSVLRADIASITQAGHDAEVWFFYSGHGWLDEAGRANLTLADGTLSQDMLYDEVLPALPGRTVHLMIDACHAEALIHSRDVTAETVEITASEVASASLRTHLKKLPHVGTVMASTSRTQAHEWDEYQTGVFTHELLSGLRGGADVNLDGRVEYSEIAAFLAAANREVTDPRAHLTTVVIAPALYPHAAIVNIRSARGGAHLQGPPGHLGRFQIDDQRGNRLVDLRAEPRFDFDIVVPAGEALLLSNESGEASLVPSIDRPTRVAELVPGKTRLRARNVVIDSMRKGLFAAEFGPSYYAGYVDSPASPMIPVDLSPSGARIETRTPLRVNRHTAAWSAFGVGAASLAASGLFAVLTAQAYSDFRDANYERASLDARTRYEDYGATTIGTAALGVLSGALGYWLWHRDSNVDQP